MKTLFETIAILGMIAALSLGCANKTPHVATSDKDLEDMRTMLYIARTTTNECALHFEKYRATLGSIFISQKLTNDYPKCCAFDPKSDRSFFYFECGEEDAMFGVLIKQALKGSTAVYGRVSLE